MCRSDTSSPLVSILIPNYNDSASIGEVIATFVEQSEFIKEIIIIDDGSTDNSVDVIKEIAAETNLVVLHENGHNRGILYSLNKALKLSTGEYVYSGSANDKPHAELLEHSIDILRKYPHAAISFSDQTFLLPEHAAPVQHNFGFLDHSGYLGPTDLVAAMSRCLSFSIPTNTAIWNRRLLQQAGGFPSDLLWYTDWYMAMSLAIKHGACYIPKHLGTFQVSNDSYASRGYRNARAQCKVIKAILGRLNADEDPRILEGFRVPAVLSNFGFVMLWVLISRAHYRRFLSSALARRIICNRFRIYTMINTISPLTPNFMKRWYRAIRPSTT